MIGLGWGHGASAIMLLYGALLFLGVMTHVVWSYRTGSAVWSSDKALLLKLALIVSVVVTPIIGFYALMSIQNIRQQQPHSAKRLPAFIMPTVGLCAVVACALDANLRYAPEYRSAASVIGFLPGFLAFYVVMQAIIHMAASVYGLTRSSVLSGRTHLVSTGLLLLAVFAPLS